MRKLTLDDKNRKVVDTFFTGYDWTMAHGIIKLYGVKAAKEQLIDLLVVKANRLIAQETKKYA